MIVENKTVEKADVNAIKLYIPTIILYYNDEAQL